jgi:hypothetical protein
MLLIDLSSQLSSAFYTLKMAITQPYLHLLLTQNIDLMPGAYHLFL